MDIRPEVQQACEDLIRSYDDEVFIDFELHIPDDDPLNEAEINALTDAFRRTTYLQEVELRGESFGRMLPFIARELIPNHSSLMWLTLADCKITREHATAIANTVKRSTCSLRVLVLVRNELGGDAAAELANGLRENNSLDHFAIAGNTGVGLEGLQAIASAVLAAESKFGSTRNSIGLLLPCNDLGVECASVIAHLIRKAKFVFGVYLGGNNMGNEGCRIIASAIPHTISLLNLSLEDNNTNDEGCEAIVHALQHNCSLTALILKGNEITDAGAAALESSLQNVNYALESLDLDGCEGVSRDRKDRIALACATNARTKEAFGRLNNNLASVPLGLWPQALEVIGAKPDFLFAMVKANADLYIKRRPRRSRKRPQWLRY